MCYLFVFKKIDFEKKVILIAFHFRVKIDFFDKIIFLKILNKHLKMTKVVLNKRTHRFFFFTRKN